MTARGGVPVEGCGNEVAPAGAVFVCGACGKRSRDLYGDQKIDRGWDESCMLNGVLVDEASVVVGPDGRVAKAEAWKGAPA